MWLWREREWGKGKDKETSGTGTEYAIYWWEGMLIKKGMSGKRELQCVDGEGKKRVSHNGEVIIYEV